MRKTLPSRLDAIHTIIEEARADRRRVRSFAKCSVALSVLGLDNVETTEVLYHLELCAEDGKPWPVVGQFQL